MPLFKEPVALEACPAKTAESVSYGATFAVLAWLLATNYLGVGFAAGEDGRHVDPRLAPLETPVIAAQTRREAPEQTGPSQLQPSPELQFNEPSDVGQPEFVVWHASLDLGQRPTIDESRWTELPSPLALEQGQAQQTIALSPMQGLSLPLPLVDAANLTTSAEGVELANNEAEGSTAIHEITVFAEESERLTARPDNISRPQIPRPLRAQQVQRSLLLPPRIQALRP